MDFRNKKEELAITLSECVIFKNNSLPCDFDWVLAVIYNTLYSKTEKSQFVKQKLPPQTSRAFFRVGDVQGFNSGPKIQLSWLKFQVIFLSSTQYMLQR